MMASMVRCHSTGSFLANCASGLIRWKFVTHCFTDGKSRVVPAVRVSTNNLGATVVKVFWEGVGTHGLPSRVRGDHGVENLMLAHLMDDLRGAGRGSYIFGRSVLELFRSSSTFSLFPPGAYITQGLSGYGWTLCLPLLPNGGICSMISNTPTSSPISTQPTFGLYTIFSTAA